MYRRLFLLFALGLALSAPEPAAGEIRVGFAYPLSGRYAATGTQNRIAVELAVQDLNEAGGVLGEKLKLITADDVCGLEQALSAARRLVLAKVSAVIGHMCSHSSLLAAGIYETADVLMISPGSTHPRLTEEGRSNVFRLTGRDDHQGKLAGDLLADHWAGSDIAILHDGSTYGEGLAARTRERLRERGIKEAIYDFYTPSLQDYSGLIARLRQAGVDVLYIGGYGPDAGLMARTARERGYEVQLIGGDGLSMIEFWLAAGEAGAGTIFSRRAEAPRSLDASKVVARIAAQSSREGDGGLRAYAALEVWAKAVERTATLDLTPVAEMLRRGRFNTILGPIAFNQQGDLEDAGWEWKVWESGRHAPLSRVFARQ